MFKDNFSRYEFKFPLSYDDMDRMIDDLLPHVKADEHVNEYGIYTISSIYLDNEQLQCYYETVNNDFFRQKVRLRVYGKHNTAESPAFLEIKGKIDGLVVKRRVKMRLGDAVAFIDECAEKKYDFDIEKYESTNPQILKELRQVIVSKNLKPVNVVSYERLPLVALEDKGLRITFDFLLRTRGDELDLAKGTHGEKTCPKNVAILELKTEKDLPYWLVKILGKYNYRNQTFSKYCSHYAPMRVNVEQKNDDEGDLKNVQKLFE